MENAEIKPKGRSSNGKKPTPEKFIEHRILAYLRSKGIFCFKVPSAGYFDPNKKSFRRHSSPFVVKGMSDIFAIFNGKMLCIEVKSEKGKLSHPQELFIKSINENGGQAFVARGIEDVEEKLFPKENA